jgi:hypothetical protein
VEAAADASCYTAFLWHAALHIITTIAIPICAGPRSDLIQTEIGKDARRGTGGLFICTHDESGFPKV